MSKMTVIQLLNKIANGEEVPEKIRYCSDLYEIDYRYMDYKNKYINDTYLLRDVISSSEELCNKIEVVEEVLEDTPKEDKKIKKLDLEDDGNTITLFGEKENEWTILDNVDIIVCNKINEIIDKINTKK